MGGAYVRMGWTVFTAGLLFATGCDTRPFQNKLAADDAWFETQPGLTLSGFEEVSALAYEARVATPAPTTVGTVAPRNDPAGHHVATAPEPAVSPCSAAPFGLGGTSNLLRRSGTVASSSYALTAISLVPSTGQQASSSSYSLRNIWLKGVQTCPAN